MATTIQTLIDRAREHLIEPEPNFWSDTALLVHAVEGIKDLWRAIKAVYQDYFLTVDTTNVSLAAAAYTLTGVPADVSIVRLIRPRDLTAFPYTRFEFRPWGHPDFITAEAQGTLAATQVRLLYFCITDAGAPVGTPTVRVAPAIDTALTLSFSYIPVIGTLTAASNNPIPGETDDLIVAWIVAYARAKEREDRSPDLVWLAKYKDGRDTLLTSVTPRQEQDDEVAEAMFEDYW